MCMCVFVCVCVWLLWFREFNSCLLTCSENLFAFRDMRHDHRKPRPNQFFYPLSPFFPWKRPQWNNFRQSVNWTPGRWNISLLTVHIICIRSLLTVNLCIIYDEESHFCERFIFSYKLNGRIILLSKCWNRYKITIFSVCMHALWKRNTRLDLDFFITARKKNEGLYNCVSLAPTHS